jgi:DNA-binding response OmpR family regulator
MRVLIVDDEPSIRKTTRIALETAGHSAAEAATAARALKAVAEEAFDAVFLDLNLGTDNGLETLVARRTLFPRAKLLGRLVSWGPAAFGLVRALIRPRI